MADVGRHIRNGEFFFRDPQVLWTNFYSYTEPDFPVMNHHWGAGVIFYLVWKWFDFTGLHIFFALLSLVAFGLFFFIAEKRDGLAAACLAAIPMIPVLAIRNEIRPEVFSYICSGLFLWVLLRWRERPESFKHLPIVLPLLEIFWVNVHIYFILGPAIVGTFWLDSIITRRDKRYSRKLLQLLALTFLGTFLNPFGYKGALAPFTIFQNYGYAVIENQPVWYVDRFYSAAQTMYFKIGFALLAASFIVAAIKRRASDIPFPYFVFATTFSLMGWLAIRNFALFGLFSIPVLSTNIALAFERNRIRWERIIRPLVLLISVIFVVLFISGLLSRFFLVYPEVGFGLARGNTAAAEYFKNNKLQGPIFNNYEVGSYLIFYLFPQERVFVDNRPEAYSEAFFQQAYIPMQQYEEKWQEMDRFFGFRTIIVARGDMTPWMSSFLYARMSDPHWQRVFADPFILIFTKR